VGEYSINIAGGGLGSALSEILGADDIQPGTAPSYQLCKTLYAYHPLGLKMTAGPVKMAQSQQRVITVAGSPEDRVVQAFIDEWKAIKADKLIANCAALSRAYGVASIALLTEGTPTERSVDFKALHDDKVSFNVLDPLNTAGSLVLSQNPNALDFQKSAGIRVAGQAYHRSRTVTLLNEEPIYIEYTQSAFGYVGRSVFQRALFPLKTYIQSLLTDNLVVIKSGVLIAKVKQQGSIIDNLSAIMTGQKRTMIKDAAQGNVLSISPDEEIETLNMQNLDGAYGMARKNCLENVATAADMPAKLLNSETFAEGFGEGTEDAKHVAEFVSGIREWMQPAYEFFDQVVMYRAWNPEFYKVIQGEFPERYANVPYQKAFYDWRNAFQANWPNLLEEPDSEKVKVDDVKLKAAIAMVEVLLPAVDPENKATLIQWAADNFNELKMMFTAPLLLDYEALATFEPPVAAEEPGEPKPFAAQDSDRSHRAMDAYGAAVERLSDRRRVSDGRGKG
jgi:hypothetical protein